MSDEAMRKMPNRPQGMVSNSDVERSSAPRGQQILRSFGRDDSSYEVANTHGGKMGGSATNLSHSLTGSSAVQNRD